MVTLPGSTDLARGPEEPCSLWGSVNDLKAEPFLLAVNSRLAQAGAAFPSRDRRPPAQQEWGCQLLQRLLPCPSPSLTPEGMNELSSTAYREGLSAACWAKRCHTELCVFGPSDFCGCVEST